MSIHWHGRVLSMCSRPEKRSHRSPDGCGESAEDQAEEVEVAGLRRPSYPSAAFATEATWCSTHQPEHQQSSSNSTMARVLLLAASAAALRPTLPRRSRTTTRAALTMHDYDYDARAVRTSNCPLLNFTPSTRRLHPPH